MKKLTIGLPTIHCESCTKLIGMTLENIPGIQTKEFNIGKRELYLTIDATTSGEAIVKAIREDAGYDASVMSEEDEESSPALTPEPSPRVERGENGVGQTCHSE